MERASEGVTLLYRCKPLKKKIAEMIKNLPPAYQKKLPEAFRDIENNPYYHPTGKISPFKGDLKHLGWHYDLGWGYRIHYEVDEELKEITITYVGPHPKY